MSDTPALKRRQLGLLLASLVLLCDCLPLGLWTLRLMIWTREIQAQMSHDPLISAFQTVGMVFLGAFGLLLGVSAAATAGSSVAVASGKKNGVVTGVLVTTTVVAISAYLVLAGVADDPRPWYACVGANAVTGAYLGFFLRRLVREEKMPTATGDSEQTRPESP